MYTFPLNYSKENVTRRCTEWATVATIGGKCARWENGVVLRGSRKSCRNALFIVKSPPLDACTIVFVYLHSLSIFNRGGDIENYNYLHLIIYLTNYKITISLSCNFCASTCIKFSVERSLDTFQGHWKARTCISLNSVWDRSRTSFLKTIRDRCIECIRPLRFRWPPTDSWIVWPISSFRNAPPA